MDPKRTLIWLGVGLLGYTLYQKYKLYEGLQFDFAGISFSGSLSNPVLNVKMSLNNPTNVAATLQSIDGLLYDGAQPVSRVIYDTVQVIQPYGRTLINLKFLPDLPSVITSAANYFKNRSSNFHFQGKAVVDSLPVPVRMDYKLN